MQNKLHLNITGLAPENASALRTFLRAVQKAGEETFFHPHPFTPSYVKTLSAKKTKDIYLLGHWNRRVLCYGMLRGWDEGYDVPSLGMAVHPDYRQMGLGRMMMLCLHANARLREAKSIRLKVYKNNISAAKLYKKLGYRMTRLNNEELLGIYEF